MRNYVENPLEALKTQMLLDLLFLAKIWKLKEIKDWVSAKIIKIIFNKTTRQEIICEQNFVSC